MSSPLRGSFRSFSRSFSGTASSTARRTVAGATALLLGLVGVLASTTAANAALNFPGGPTVTWSDPTISAGESSTLQMTVNGWSPDPYTAFYADGLLIACNPGQGDATQSFSYEDLTGMFPNLNTFSAAYYDSESFTDCPPAFDDAGALAAATLEIAPTIPVLEPYTVSADKSDLYDGDTATITTSDSANHVVALLNAGAWLGVIGGSQDFSTLAWSDMMTCESTDPVTLEYRYYDALVGTPEADLIDDTTAPAGSVTMTWHPNDPTCTPVGPTVNISADQASVSEGQASTFSTDATTQAYAYFLDNQLLSVGNGPASSVNGEVVDWASYLDCNDTEASIFEIRIYDFDYTSADAENITAMTGALTSAGINLIPREVACTVAQAPATIQSTNLAWESFTATWTAPATDGGTPVTGYKVYLNGLLMASLPAGTLTYDFSNLSESTEYVVTVLATNFAGSSEVITLTETTPMAPRSIVVSPKTLNGVIGTEMNESVGVTLQHFGWAGTNLTATGLPEGLTFNANCDEGCAPTITGTPTTAGTYTVTVTVLEQDGITTHEDTLTIVVTETPVIPVDPTDPTDPKDPTGGTDELAYTGSQTLALGGFSAALMAYGALLLVATRRRATR